MQISGGIALCVAAAAIRDCGQIRERIDTIINLLEAALDQGEAMTDDSPEKRRGMCLVRLAVEKAQLNGEHLAGIEANLSARVLEQAALSAEAGCADLGSRGCS